MIIGFGRIDSKTAFFGLILTLPTVWKHGLTRSFNQNKIKRRQTNVSNKFEQVLNNFKCVGGTI